MTAGNAFGLNSVTDDLGASKFTFTGDRTSITFFPQTPGPVIIGHEGGEFVYSGPEGNFTRFGRDIERADTSLGYQLTIPLVPDTDAGEISITVLLPRAFGVERDSPVTFGTVAIKTTGRGFTENPGVEVTYDVLPLVGVAEDVILPL